MLSSAKTQNRLNDASAAIDKRTNGSKRRSEAIMEKPQNALRLLDNALNTGITAKIELLQHTLVDQSIAYQELVQERDQALSDRNQYENKTRELEGSLEQSSVQLLDIQEQFEQARQEAAAQLKATEAEAAIAQEDSQRELQSMRDCAAEAEAKIELLQQTIASQTSAYQELLQERDQALTESTHYEAQAKELQELLQHSSVQLIEIQAQFDQAKQEFAAQLEATAAEAAQALEEAQIDLQTMRDSLAQAEESREQSAQLVGLAENISAEAAAKNELLQQTLAHQTRAYQQELAQASDKALIERTHYEAKTNELEELLQHSSV